jgi:oligopeptide/dipeptide ABC transporter ATP-binding protein
MSTGEPTGSERMLAVENLSVEYRPGKGKAPVRALRDVSLSVRPGETVGVVGESGSGKTTLGRAILGLAPIVAGSVSFEGQDITTAGRRTRSQLSRRLQVVFQDPYGSFNPTRTVGQTLAESLRGKGDLPKAAVRERVEEMLERVGLPGDAAGRYPGHFSGGQRQRIAIARALMVEPRLVICDEVVSALDLSVQAQVLNLLRDLQRELHLSYLFIAHDLDVVRYLSDQVVVLYRGRIMEEGPAEALYETPSHPYTRALLEAAPVPDPELQRQRRHSRTTQGSADSTPTPGVGCPFYPRCPHAVAVCRERVPPLDPTDTGARAACHRWSELALFDGASERNGRTAKQE